MSAGEAVDVYLSSVRSGGWARQGVELVLKFIGIVGERIQVLPLDDHGIGVVGGTGIHADSLVGHVDLLRLAMNLQREFLVRRLVGEDQNLNGIQGSKSICSSSNQVATRFQMVDGKSTVADAGCSGGKSVLVGERNG